MTFLFCHGVDLFGNSLHVDKDDDIEEKSDDDKDDKAEDPECGSRWQG